MGLWERYKRVKKAEKTKKKSTAEVLDVDELDDFELDAGDALEAEVLRELANERTRKKR